jgi:hypothetical protein
MGGMGTPFDAAQARRVIELMVLSAWADGHVEGSEAITIQRQVSGSPLLEGVGPVVGIASDARSRLLSQGMEACLAEAVRGITEKAYRELAFQCSAKVMGADRLFPLEEEGVLHKLQELLGLSKSDVERLLVLATR